MPELLHPPSLRSCCSSGPGPGQQGLGISLAHPLLVASRFNPFPDQGVNSQGLIADSLPNSSDEPKFKAIKLCAQVPEVRNSPFGHSGSK